MKPNGLATAVALEGAFSGLVPDADAQSELFTDAVDAPSSLPPAAGKRAAHRPKGARGRSTEEWRNYVLSGYQAPIIGLAETWSRSVDELAAALNLTKVVQHLAPGQQALEKIYVTRGDAGLVFDGYLVWDREKAFEIQQAARIAAMPYLHQKQPLAVALEGDKRGLLVLGDLTVNAIGGGSNDLSVPFAPSEQNQGVIDAEVVQSHDEQSHDFDNALKHQEE